MSTLRVDVGQLFEAQPPPDKTARPDSYDVGVLLGMADLDYVVFRGLALTDLQRGSLFHLQQAVEKFLKAILLARGALSDEEGRTHDLVKLVAAAARLYPVLADRSLEIFCRVLSPFQQFGHYPEAILDYLRLTPCWNAGHRRGIREADLVIANLRAIAIDAMGARLDANYLLEAVVHGDMLPFVSGSGRAVEDGRACLRTWLLSHNRFFTPESLPTYRQRYQDRIAFPLVPLPTSTYPMLLADL